MKYYLLAFLILGWSPGLKLSQSTRFPQFQLSNGGHVTCVPIREQLSLRSLPDPLYTYQEPTVKPSYGLSKTSRTSGDLPGIKLAGQLFNTEVGTCPEGTVPVRESLGNVTRKVGGTKHHGKRSDFTTRNAGKSTNSSVSDPQVDTSEHEYGVARSGGTTPVGGYYGAGASFNIWQPHVETSTEFSLSQLWIASGSSANKDLNTIEVGWQVYEQIYGDKLPHLFVYWTRDAYSETGCYNLDCSGFVQTSSNRVIGGAWSSVSRTNGDQQEVKLLVFLDSKQGVWWLEVNDETVGYWPTSLFTRLKTGAEVVEWGGEIVNVETGGRHTETDMGSGAFASEGFRKAAYIRLMQTVDQANTLHDAAVSDRLVITDASCYNAEKGVSIINWGTYIFFGGAGYSTTSCPV